MAAINALSRLMEVYGSQVQFEVTRSGSDHDPTFTTIITVQGISATGVGSNKKNSKQNAALQLEKLLNTGNASPQIQDVVKNIENNPINPIKRFQQIGQSAISDPVRTLNEIISKRNDIKIEYEEPESVLEIKCVAIGDFGHGASRAIVGVGYGKKIQEAKEAAAKNLVCKLTEAGATIKQENVPEPKLIELAQSNFLSETKVVDGIGALGVDDSIQGSFQKLEERLRDRNEKVKVIEMANKSAKHSIILIAELIGKDPFSNMVKDYPTWAAQHENLETAKDIAAKRALDHLDEECSEAGKK